MSVTDVDIAFETDGGTGMVRLTATWEGLAATDGDRLTVAEPFASGFEPERTFVVDVPEGYAVDGAAPEPDERTDGRLVWTAGSDLSGFEVTASACPEDRSESQPGERSGAFLRFVVGVAVHTSSPKERSRNTDEPEPGNRSHTGAFSEDICTPPRIHSHMSGIRVPGALAVTSGSRRLFPRIRRPGR
jgi:hypothetical protein